MKISHFGGYSEAVRDASLYKDYTKNNMGIYGAIGHSERTDSHDRILELALRKQGLGDNDIACWLTSTTARHCLNGMKRMSGSEFANHIKSYVKDAFIEITIYSHPDHDGFLSSSNLIRAKLQNFFCK